MRLALRLDRLWTSGISWYVVLVSVNNTDDTSPLLGI